MDLRSEGENGGRERKVKVPGEWVAPGLAGGLPTGTEIDKRHHRQMAEARDEQMELHGHRCLALGSASCNAPSPGFG